LKSASAKAFLIQTAHRQRLAVWEKRRRKHARVRRIDEFSDFFGRCHLPKLRWPVKTVAAISRPVKTPRIASPRLRTTLPKATKSREYSLTAAYVEVEWTRGQTATIGLAAIRCTPSLFTGSR
jgi:hypothetical protein